MKHTPARGKAHRPVLGESARLATGACKKTPGGGGTPCVGRASPFGPHPRKEKRDFLGGPVVKTVLPQQGPWVPSPVAEDPTCPLAWPKKKKRKEVPQTPATHPDTSFHCPCHFPFCSFLSPPNVPILPVPTPLPISQNTNQIHSLHPGFPEDPVNIVAVYLASTQLPFSWCVTVLACTHAL